MDIRDIDTKDIEILEVVDDHHQPIAIRSRRAVEGAG